MELDKTFLQNSKNILGIVNITPDSFSGDGLFKKENKLSKLLDFAERNNIRNLDIGCACAPGYFELPACLLNHNSSETNYLLSIISRLVGQSGLQTSDIKNMFKALSSGKQVSYFENWIVSQQLGLLIFVNKEEWKFKQNTNSFGYFQFVTTEYRES